jgi:hypothetical protein
VIVYKEFEEIAKGNEERETLKILLSTMTDIEGLNLESARLIRGCVEKDGHLYNVVGARLDNCGLVDDEYYCYQQTGDTEDFYYGTLYYATEEKGTFVAIPFDV